MKRANKNESTETHFRLRPFSRGLLKRFKILQSKRVVSVAGWGALASIPGLAFAGPTGESVAAGAVDVTRSQANRTEINQSSQNAIVNWNTFSIEGNEYVLIQQPNASSTILNRVIGSQQSRILGQLQANGRVFLVNPNGVLVAPGASIDVGAITMSAMDIADDDFMAGNYVFSGDGGAAGVENGGTITTAEGGFVVLAGDYVNNTGVITATLGTVVLAAGEQVTLDIDNDGLVGFAVDEATVSELAGVENTGDIIADGGRVLMTASVANDLVATAVNNQGLVQAHRIEEQGGEIFLTGYGADVNHGGTIDVSGKNGHAGGTAIIHGDRDVVVQANSQINATGSGEAGGGFVRVVADGVLNFKTDAEIDVGDKGFVELSGHSGLTIDGAVNVGQGGELLIDPAVLTINNNGNSPSSSSMGSYGGSCPTSACVGKGFIEGQLNGGGNVTIVASQEIRSSGGPFTINATSSEGASGDLAVKIGTVSGATSNCNNFGVCTGGVTFTPDSNGDINLGDVNINILGDFDASAGTLVGDVNLGTINAGNVNVTAGMNTGDITVGQVTANLSSSFGSSLLVAGGGAAGIAAASTDLSLTALGGDITVNGNLNLLGSFFTRVDLKANPVSGTGTIRVNGNISTSASSGDATIRLEAGSNIFVSGNMTAIGSTADVSASADNIQIDGTTRARAFSDTATVMFDANNTLNTGGISADGTSGRVDLYANNITTNGNVSVSGTSAARFSALANNNLTLNGLVNVTEGGGGFARVSLGADNGIAIINGGINVIAGPGGSASVLFGSSEGSSMNSLLINKRVFASGPLGSQITANVKNSIRTAGNGLLQADSVAVRTNGNSPTVKIDTKASQIFVDVLGGAPNLTVNNTTHVGPTSIFLNGGNFRSTTVLSNFNLNFFGAFQSQNLLVGAPNGIVSFNDAVFINGANPFPATAPDLELFSIMSTRGLTPPGHGANVQILGGNGINMANPFVLGGPDPFIKMFSNRGFNTPGLTTNASNILAVFNPINLASPILFGDTPQIPAPGTLGFFNSVNIQGLPDNDGTTVVIGERGFAIPFLNGPVSIGPGSIDLGDRNMFIISRGTVFGDDLVTTNGIFEIIGLADTNVFQIPIIRELGESETETEEDDDDEILGDASNSGDDGDEGSISEESNSKSMECAA